MENKKYVIGADIGGTTVKLGLFEEDGTLEKVEIPTVIEGDGTAVRCVILRRKFKSAEKSTTFPQTVFWAWARVSPGR